MKLTDVTDDQQLWDCMTEPSEGLVECCGRLDGPVVILGGSGKMGRELTGMLLRADSLAGTQREVTVASTFSNSEDRQHLEALGVRCAQGDLSDSEFLQSLPDAPSVIYMLGFKFGSSGDWRRTFHLNAVVPYLAGEKYARSSIVMFSSGNFYQWTPPDSGGSRETDPLDPKGIYGWSLVARDSAFCTTALQSPEQRICLYRLFYAQHLCYGVLVDLAGMILRGEPVSLSMPAVNLISQRDANDVALRALEYCANPPWALNVAGPPAPVRDIVDRLAALLNKKPQFTDAEGPAACIGNDDRCRELFGPCRDSIDEMLAAAVGWVQRGGSSWNKPTKFGVVSHTY